MGSVYAKAGKVVEPLGLLRGLAETVFYLFPDCVYFFLGEAVAQALVDFHAEGYFVYIKFW